MKTIFEWTNQTKKTTIHYSYPEYKIYGYYRLTQRYILATRYKTFDIAQIISTDEKKGNLKKFLDKIENHFLKQNISIFVECVLNERLMKILEIRNYQKIKDGDSISYFLKSN